MAPLPRTRRMRDEHEGLNACCADDDAANSRAAGYLAPGDASFLRVSTAFRRARCAFAISARVATSPLAFATRRYRDDAMPLSTSSPICSLR